MRHKVYGNKLNRDKNQRTALFRGLVRSLILHNSITTTEAKAKAIKGQVDKLITAARKNTNASQRILESFLVQKDIIKKINSEIAPRYKDRSSGFTRIIKLGHRQGDAAMLAQLSFVESDSSKKSKKVKEDHNSAEEAQEVSVSTSSI